MDIGPADARGIRLRVSTMKADHCLSLTWGHARFLADEIDKLERMRAKDMGDVVEACNAWNKELEAM